MRKHLITIFTVLSASMVYAQEGRVGINTSTPNATLDVTASPTDLTRTDGFIAPRLTGDELKAKDSNYTNDQTGAIIYATAPANPTTAKTINVTEAGYYYFDGTVWQKIKGGEDKTDDEWINDPANGKIHLGKLSDGVTARPVGSEFAALDDGRVGIGTETPNQLLHIKAQPGINAAINLDSDPSRNSQVRFSHGGVNIWKVENTVVLPGYPIPNFRIFNYTLDKAAIIINENNNKIILGGGLGSLSFPSEDLYKSRLTVNGYVTLGSSDETGDVTPSPGMIRYNDTTNKFQGYVGGATPGWVDLN